MAKDKRVIKPKTGHSPAIMGKGSAHKVKTKYTRKEKHSVRTEERKA